MFRLIQDNAELSEIQQAIDKHENKEKFISEPDEWGVSSLAIAIRFGRSDVVRLLLEKYAPYLDVNQHVVYEAHYVDVQNQTEEASSRAKPLIEVTSLLPFDADTRQSRLAMMLALLSNQKIQVDESQATRLLALWQTRSDERPAWEASEISKFIEAYNNSHRGTRKPSPFHALTEKEKVAKKVRLAIAEATDQTLKNLHLKDAQDAQKKMAETYAASTTQASNSYQQAAEETKEKQSAIHARVKDAIEDQTKRTTQQVQEHYQDTKKKVADSNEAAKAHYTPGHLDQVLKDHLPEEAVYDHFKDETHRNRPPTIHVDTEDNKQHTDDPELAQLKKKIIEKLKNYTEKYLQGKLQIQQDSKGYHAYTKGFRWLPFITKKSRALNRMSNRELALDLIEKTKSAKTKDALKTIFDQTNLQALAGEQKTKQYQQAHSFHRTRTMENSTRLKKEIQAIQDQLGSSKKARRPL